MTTQDIIKIDEHKAGEFAAKGVEIRDKSLAYKVTDEATKLKAEEGLKIIKKMKASVIDFTKDTIAGLYDLHRKEKTRQNNLLEPLQAADRHLRRQVEDYEMEKIREQRRKDEEARKKREAELKAAEEAEESGDTEKAEEILTKAAEEEAAPVVYEPEVKTKGVGKKIEWKWRLTNIEEVPRDFLILDESALSRYAKAMKEKAKVSGVQFYEVVKTSIR